MHLLYGTTPSGFRRDARAAGEGKDMQIAIATRAEPVGGVNHVTDGDDLTVASTFMDCAGRLPEGARAPDRRDRTDQAADQSAAHRQPPLASRARLDAAID